MCKRKEGFTLIELLIVVAIIAILAAIAVPNFLEAQVRAKVSRARADMRSIEVAIEAYRLDTNEYPPPSQHATIRINHYYKCLTTPIAYLSTAYLDPFTPYGANSFVSSAAQERVYGRGARCPYGYHGPPTFNANNVAVRYNICWTLTSAGPDMCWDWYPDGKSDGPGGLFYGEPQYDPTNGTVSRGNVERCGPGNIPGDYFRYIWNNQMWLK